MKNKRHTLLWLSVIIAGYFSLTSSQQEATKQNRESTFLLKVNDDLKNQAFQILDTKCNICNQKQNPFMVFSLKNMEKRASKIYKQVFEKRRMPKGDKIKLSQQEHDLLKEWLNTQNIN